MGLHKGGIKIVVGALLLVMATAAAAWACTPQAPLQILGPSAVASQAKVTAQGSLNSHGPATAEIRWNAASGPVLGSITALPGQPFSIDVIVPEVAPGVYYLLLTSEGAGVARAAIEVTPAQGPSGATTQASESSTSVRAVAPDLWGGFINAGRSPAGTESLAFAGSRATEPASAMSLGIILVAFSVTALFSGAATVLVKKKTASASGRRDKS